MARDPAPQLNSTGLTSPNRHAHRSWSPRKRPPRWALFIYGGELMDETMTWCMFLHYLSTPNGIAVATGIAWSLLIEYVTLFHTLTTKWKRVTFFVLSILLPLLAAAIPKYISGNEFPKPTIKMPTSGRATASSEEN